MRRRRPRNHNRPTRCECNVPPHLPRRRPRSRGMNSSVHMRTRTWVGRVCACVCKFAFPTHRPAKLIVSLSPSLEGMCSCPPHSLCPHRKLRVPFSLIYDLYRARSPAHSYSRPLPPITNRATRVSPAATLTSSAAHRNFIRRQSAWLRAKRVHNGRRLN